MAASKAGTSPIAATREREIVVSRLFDAPREMVWAAWTDPRQVAQWWGPKGFRTTIHEMDVRPGGKWRHTMHGPDGADYPNQSVFLEVTQPERIVYSHAGGKKGAVGASFEATWTFEAQGEKGDQTLLTIRMVFASAKDREHVVKEYGAIEGGKQTLGRLAEHLEGMSVVIERTFDAPAPAVWRALTDLEQMKQWYFPTLAAFKPEVGFETRVDVEYEGKLYIHFWKVTEAVPNKKIAYSWKYAGNPGESLVSFELFPEGNKTRLKLSHTGLETFDPKTNPDYASKNFFQGWTHFSTALAQFLEKPALGAGHELVLERVFDAPRDRVWQAWTDEKQLQQWWGPHGFDNPRCEWDARPGGRIYVVMRGFGMEHPMPGRFEEVVPPERLVFITEAFVDEAGKNPQLQNRNTVTFTAEGGKTRVKVHVRVLKATPQVAQALAGMEQGWSQSLEKLATLVAKG